MTIDQLSVFVENRPGKLVEVIEALGAAGLDLRAMSIADTADFGVLRLIVDRPEAARDALTAAGYVVKLSPVIPVAIDDAPGSLGRVLRLLSDGGVDVAYAYAFVAHGRGRAHVILRTGDDGAALEILRAGGVALASESDVYAK